MSLPIVSSQNNATKIVTVFPFFCCRCDHQYFLKTLSKQHCCIWQILNIARMHEAKPINFKMISALIMTASIIVFNIFMICCCCCCCFVNNFSVSGIWWKT